MKTFYIVGYPRNQDGKIRKNGKRKVLGIAHDEESIGSELEFAACNWKTKYDYRVFDGLWREVDRAGKIVK